MNLKAKLRKKRWLINENEKPAYVCNPNKRKLTKPASQMVSKTLIVREMFLDMKDETSGNAELKRCVKFLG